MKTRFKRRQWVENFLNGHIDPDQAIIDLTKDAKLREELEFESSLREALCDEELLRFEEILEGFRQTTRNKRTGIIHEPKVFYISLLAVASVALLLIIYYATPSIFNPDPFRAELNANAEFPGEIFRDSRGFYDSVAVLSSQDKFVEANAVMEAAVDTGDIGVIYARGITRYNAGLFTDAILDFNKVVTHTDNLFLDDALWYRAIALFRTDQMESSLKDFSRLSDIGGPHAAKATKLARYLTEKSGE